MSGPPRQRRVTTIKPPKPRPGLWEPLEQVEADGEAEVFRNRFYEVRRLAPNPNAFVRAACLDDPLWLIVWRRDGKPPRDWRHLQEIKNELAGSEREALELFPAESRRIDTGNATHLWVMPAGEHVPFGAEGRRLVLDAGERAGMTQRAFATPSETTSRFGRNSPCACGSGKKFKRCCGA